MSAWKKYRAEVYALIAYTLLAIALTYPLILNVATHVPGDGSDDPALAWNLWWVPYSIINLGKSPIYTDYMFYPVGLNLAFYTLTYLNAFLSIPFQSAFNVIVAANANVWLSFVLSGLGGFLLVRYLLRNANGESSLANYAAFAAGAVYAFSSNKFLYASLGQFNIASSQWIPFYVLVLVKLTKDGGRRTEAHATIKLGILLGLFLLFQALAEFIFASFLIIFTAIYLAYWFAVKRFSRMTFYVLRFGILPAMIVFTIPMLPILAAMLQDMATEGDFIQSGLGFADVFSSDALGFFVPSQLHPLFGKFAAQFHFAYINFAYLGFAALSVALIAVAFVKRARIWAMFGLLFVWISLGPVLTINGMRYDVPMPFNWLLEIPFIKGNRYPSRWSVMVTLCLAILVGYGTAWWLVRFSRNPQRGKRDSYSVLRGSSFILLIAILLFEHLSAPLPLSNLSVPDVYQTIARDPGDFTVLEIPLAWRNGFRMTGTLDQAMMFAQFYQTAHHHPLLGGNTSRNPEFKFQYFTEAPVINSLIAVETGHKLDDATLERDKELAPDVLRFFGVRYVVWHSPRNPQNRAWLDAARAYVQYVLPVTQISQVSDDTGETIVYHVNEMPAQMQTMVRADDAMARLYLGEGWGSKGTGGTLGNQGNAVIWATRREAKIFVPIDTARDVTLTLRLFAPIPNQNIALKVNDRLLCHATLKQGWSDFSCRVMREAWQTGTNEIVLQFDQLISVAAVGEGNFAIGKTGATAPVSMVAYSAGSEVGDFAHIYINGIEAAQNKRGYNIVVFDPGTGKIEASQAFDTFAAAEEATRLAQFIDAIPNGRIVAVAVRDEASRNLTQDAVDALRTIGAQMDLRGKWRWSHALIGVKGSMAGTANESANETMPAQVVVGIGAMEPNVAAAIEWIKIE